MMQLFSYPAALLVSLLYTFAFLNVVFALVDRRSEKNDKELVGE